MAEEEVSCGCFRSSTLGFYRRFIKVLLLLNIIFEKHAVLAINDTLNSTREPKQSEIAPGFGDYASASVNNFVDSSKNFIHLLETTAVLNSIISSSNIAKDSIIPSISKFDSISVSRTAASKEPYHSVVSSSIINSSRSSSSTRENTISSSKSQSLETTSVIPSISKSIESSNVFSSHSTIFPKESTLASCHIVTQTSIVCLETASHSYNVSESLAPESLMTSLISSSDFVTTIISSSSASVPDSSSLVLISTEQLSPSLTTTMQVISSSNIPYSSVLSSSITPSSSQIQSISASVLVPGMHVCDVVARNFSVALNNYTTCVLLHLKPMEVCYQCIEQYETLKLYHRKVYHDCGKKLITRYNAQYQVIAHLFDIQQETWNSLECEKCYDRSSQVPKIIPQFVKFRELYKETKECFHSKSFPNVTAINGNSTSNVNESVCVRCKPIYSVLQSDFKYQEDTEEETVTRWCADINVAVNETRHVWSGKYHCGKKDKDMVSIIAMTCLFCFLPIVFYVGAKLHADVKERKSSRYYESQ